MSRPLRLQYEGALYHITARGNERKKIFFTQRDYQKFKEYLLLAKERFGCFIHAYVLMGNHFHLILETPDKNLSKVMHAINGAYTTYINTKRKRSGHLLQGRYKSIIVDKDCYLLELSRYLHLNPLRAGIVEHPDKYRHSSYPHYALGVKDEVVTSRMILGMVSDKEKAARDGYRRFVEGAIGEELDSPLKDVYGGLVLGSERFIRATLDRLEIAQLADEEIPGRQALRATMTESQIVKGVMRHFRLSLEELMTNKPSMGRKYAIYLLKYYAGMSSREVGALLGGMGCSAVAKNYQRFVKQMSSDGALRQDVERFWKELSNVQV